MPRSSRHKSSKHSSRDARDYSDSEKESSLKERKVKAESVAKASGSEKRKVDSRSIKDLHGSSSNGVECCSPKRRKERLNESANDRWNGGEDERHDKSKPSSEKGLRGDVYETEETKKSIKRIEGKYKESIRKESKEIETVIRDRDRDKDKERKYKEGKSENEHHGLSDKVYEKTELNSQDQLRSPEYEKHLERRARRKRDGLVDGDKRQDDNRVATDRGSLRDDITSDEMQKEEKLTDNKYREGVGRTTRHRGDKQRDERPATDHANVNSDNKKSLDRKVVLESGQKKSKPQGRNYDHEFEQEHAVEPPRECDRDLDRDRERKREREHDQRDDRGRCEHRRSREHDKDRDQGRVRDWDLDRDRDRDKDYNRGRNRDLYYERDRDIENNFDRDMDCDESYLDDQKFRYKERKRQKRSKDDVDDINDSEAKAIKDQYPDLGTKSSRVERNGDMGRSQSRQAHGDATRSRKRQNTSPSSGSHGCTDESRLMTSVSKASPIRQSDRSLSSTSLDPRYTNRSSTRQSLEVEETAQRPTKEFSVTEDRLSRDSPLEKPVCNEYQQTDSFYNKVSQSTSSFIAPPVFFRGRVGSPLIGSFEDGSRLNTNARNKRIGDPNMGRGQGNAWRGPPTWPSPMPNGFVPFQHCPPLGGFQGMMPQYSSPGIFGVRPPMEISHSGIPYHMPEAERYSNHLRPLGWQNMIDGSGSINLHGWDVSNGNIFGGAEWDPRNLMNGRGWEFNGNAGKGQNDDPNTQLLSVSQKEDSMEVLGDDTLSGQVDQSEIAGQAVRANSVGSNLSSPTKESSRAPPELGFEKTFDPSDRSTNNDLGFNSRVYLSKLDISTELAGPELHSCCMSLLEEQQLDDEENEILVNLKDGGKAVSKSSMLWRPLFSATNNSFFERAMDHYKTQRVKLMFVPIEQGTFGAPEKTDNQGHVQDMVEEQLLISEADFPKEKATTILHAEVVGDISEHDCGSLDAVSSPNVSVDVPQQETYIAEPDELKPVLDSLGGNKEMLYSSNEDSYQTINGKEEFVETPECGDKISDVPPNKVFGGVLVSETESVISRIHHSPPSTH